MILTHVLTWVCGVPVWVWRWLTVAQWRALPHVTPAMIARRQSVRLAEVAIVGCVGVGGYQAPRLIQPAAPSPVIISASPQPVDVPEPGSDLLMIVGISAAALIHKAKRRPH